MQHDRTTDRPTRGVIQRERLQNRESGAPQRVILQPTTSGEAGTSAPFAIAPILTDDRVAGIDVRCSCGRHAYIELEGES